MIYKKVYLDDERPEMKLARTWEQNLEEQTWWRWIPPAILEAMIRHTLHGTPTGGFVRACLEDRLMDAFGRADPDSTAAMEQICKFLYQNVLARSRGGRVNVKEWQASGGLVGHGYNHAALAAGATERQILKARRGCPVCHCPVFITGERLVSCQHAEAVELVSELRKAVGTWPEGVTIADVMKPDGEVAP